LTNCVGYDKLPFHERNDIGEACEKDMRLPCWKEQSGSEIILRAFPKSRKSTVSFITSVCPSVCLSVRMEQLGSLWKGFYDIWYKWIFRKSVEKIQVSLKSDKNNGYVIGRRMYIYRDVSLNYLNDKCFQAFQLQRKSNTHLMPSICFLFL
jgi:hypothetical protein